jgi:hypothetical protein
MLVGECLSFHDRRPDALVVRSYLLPGRVTAAAGNDSHRDQRKSDLHVSAKCEKHAEAPSGHIAELVCPFGLSLSQAERTER